MKKLILTIMLCNGLILVAHTQTWEQLNMHGGGFVTGLIPHPTDENALFARIDVAGIYKTTDNGDNWSSLTTTISKDNKYNYYVRSFAIDASNTDNMYFLSGNAPWDAGNITYESFLWMSSDGGSNWTKEIAPINFSGNGQYRYAGETMLISPSNANLLYLGGQPTYNWGTSIWNTDAGLYSYNTSTDTWTQLDGGALDDAWITSIQYHPTDNDYIYISAAINTQTPVNTSTIGLWKYQISTGTLTQLRTTEVYDFIFDTGNASKIITIQPSGIDISADDGNTWSGVNQPFGYAYHYFISAHPTNSNHWYIGYYTSFNQNGILQTTDGGANYYDTKYNSGSNQSKVTYPSYANTNYNPGFGNAMSTLIFHPANTAKAFVADWYGVFKTTDAATDLVTDFVASTTENSNWSWDWKSQGIYNMVQVRVTLHPTDNTIFYNCLADIGLYIGSSSGSVCTYQNTHPITSIYNVRFAPSNTTIGYAVGAHHSGKGRIVKTTDSGTSWAEPSTGSQWGSSYFETNNSTSVTDLQIADSDPNIIIVGIDKGSMSNQIYRSDNGGGSFSAWDDGLSNAMFKNWTANDKLLKDANGSTFYVWHQNELYRRALSDGSWTACTNPTGTGWFSQVITDPNNNNTLYATQYGNVIYKSTDNGINWSTITSGASRSTQISINSQGHLAVLQGQIENSSSAQGLYVSKDEGANWTNIGLNGFYSVVSGITFLQDHILLAWSANTTAARIDLTSVLPVKLSHFSGQLTNYEVLLQWQTASEENNQGFQIERKTSHSDWENIGFVNGKIYSNEVNNYEFRDHQPIQGKNYYRLKQIDMNGDHEYSNIILVENDVISSPEWHFYPNPVENELTISFHQQRTTQGKIFDTNGVLLQHFNINEKTITVDVNELKRGIYFLKIENMVKKFVKY